MAVAIGRPAACGSGVGQPVKPSRGVGIAVLLALASMATAIGIDGTLPAMPAMVEALGSTRTSVQLSLSLFMVGVAAGQLLYGPLSDRFGRKPVILAGLSLTAGAALGCALSGTIEFLVGFRFLHGMAAASGFIVARAAIRDRYERGDAARVLSMMLFFHCFGPLFAPIASAHVTVLLGWEAVFLFIASFSAFVAVLFGLVFRETLERPDRNALDLKPMLGNFVQISRSRPFWAYTACTAASYGILFSFLAASPHVIITSFGETETAYAYMFGGCMVGSMLGMLASARLVERVGADRLLRWGVCCASLFGLLLCGLAWAGVHHWLAVIGPMFCCLFSFCFIFPQAIAGALQPFPHVAGSASSLVGFTQQLAGAATGMVVAAFTTDGTQTALALGVLISALFALSVYVFAIRRHRTV